LGGVKTTQYKLPGLEFKGGGASQVLDTAQVDTFNDHLEAR
jgi:hypothetical protein